GVAESSTVVICAPHGECLGERGVFFDHHALLEASIRVPLIWKSPAGILRAPGEEIGGMFDLIDVFPTLVDSLGLPLPAGLAGASRGPSLPDGTHIPAHPSGGGGGEPVALAPRWHRHPRASQRGGEPAPLHALRDGAAVEAPHGVPRPPPLGRMGVARRRPSASRPP